MHATAEYTDEVMNGFLHAGLSAPGCMYAAHSPPQNPGATNSFSERDLCAHPLATDMYMVGRHALPSDGNKEEPESCF